MKQLGRFLKAAVLSLMMIPPALLPLSAAAGPQVQVQENPDGSFSGTISFPGVHLETRQGDQGSWTEAALAGTHPWFCIGDLLLPRFSRLIAVPQGAAAVLELSAVQEEPLAAAAPPAVTRWDRKEGRSYLAPYAPSAGTGAALPPLASITPLGLARHLNLARLEVAPVRYDAATGSWSAVRKLTFRVLFRRQGENGVSADQASTGLGTFSTGALNDPVVSRLAGEVLNPSAVSSSPASTLGPETAGGSSTILSAPKDSVMTPLKILVRESGIHKVTWSDLNGAGVDPTGIDPATFVLTYRDQEVPIEMVDGGDASFDPGDFFRFYGEDIGGEETWNNVYRLTGGVAAGMRMSSRNVTPNTLLPLETRFLNSARDETNILYFAALPNGSVSPWYWDKLAVLTLGVPNSVDHTVVLSNVSTDGSATAHLDVRMQSRRETPGPSPNHHAKIYLNGNLVDDRTWTGLLGQTLGADIPQSWVLEGTNTVTIENPADLGLTSQEEWSDWFRLDYYDTFVAESNVLRFDTGSTSESRMKVTGFTSSNLLGYDVSDPLVPLTLTGMDIQPDGMNWSAELGNAPGTAGGPFIVMADGTGLSPYGFEIDTASTLRDQASTGADMLIVSYDGFYSTAETLANHRRAEGMRVVHAKLTDVYDEFNGGIAEVQGIKNFVQWAFDNYAPPAPLYLVLVGDATYDPKDFKGNGDNYVPTHMFHETDFGMMPTDTWLAAVNGNDEIPDLAVGRISGRSATDIQNYINNLLDYENLPPVADVNSGLLYVADNDDPAFESVLEDLIASYQPPAMASRRVYLSSYPTGSAGTDMATDDIRTSIDTGSLVTTFVGHGTRTIWAGEAMWTNNDIPTLAGAGNLTVALAMNCVNGLFTNLDSEPYSLGEAWTLYADRGGIGSWSPSATGILFNYDVLSDEYFHHLFDLKETRGGLVAWNALTDAYLLDNIPDRYLRQMIYFGDPAAILPLDSDRDSLLDQDELAAGTDPNDADGDDDGITDDQEPSWNLDPDGDGAVNAIDHDSDNDGLPDGLETGLTSPDPATDTTVGHWVADADPLTTTDMQDADTDGGGAPDGAEDRSVNGLVDGAETDPNNPLDDPVCAGVPPVEVTGLAVDKDGDDLVITWDDQIGSDPCLLYRVYIESDGGPPDDFARFVLAGIATTAEFRHHGAGIDGIDHHYLVTATAPAGAGGEGPLGHYGR